MALGVRLCVVCMSAEPRLYARHISLGGDGKLIVRCIQCSPTGWPETWKIWNTAGISLNVENSGNSERPQGKKL